MAEKEDHARVHKRGIYTNRARPGQNRLYHHLGVRDLRELLDRKRSEKGHEANLPPPDPSYSYLKDPFRENTDNNPQEHLPRHSDVRKHYNKNNSNDRFKRDNEHLSNQSKSKNIENPLNIKIEFSTATGVHTYKMDESTVLPTIKHVPDQLPQNRSFRGRGRGRGRGQNYQTRTIKNNASNKKSVFKELPVNQLQPETSCTSLSAEENWDDDLEKNKKVNDGDEEVVECEKQEQLQSNEIQDTRQEDILEEDLQNLKLNEASSNKD